MSKPTQLRHNSPAGDSSTAEGETVLNPFLVEIRFNRGDAHPPQFSVVGKGGGWVKEKREEREGELAGTPRETEHGGSVEGFEEFWAAFPRREAKKDAMKAWGQMTAEQRFAAVHAIPVHVRFWNLAGRSKQYIPLPATWLRGERWEDELEMPTPSEPMGEWWKTPAGIEAKARQVGCWPARPNEGWHELKARILAKERAA